VPVEQKVDLPVNLTLQFPLPDGRELVRGPLTYNFDGVATFHVAEFLKDERFKRAWVAGVSTEHQPPEFENYWGIYIHCWAAQHALRLPGDFVDCGVHTGISARAAADYVAFESVHDKTWFLVDTYAGAPIEQFTAEELQLGAAERAKRYALDTFGIVQRSFARYSNVRLVKGAIPESLSQVTCEKIAYLSIDLGSAYAETSVARVLWKRMVRSAIAILDGYASESRRTPLKAAWDELAAEMGFSIVTVPTGQGLLIKA